MYLQPIKNDDPRLDFFAMYKREAMEYDTDYMQKCNEDLNTTLIFVRFTSLLSVYSADRTLRPVYSPLSAPPSSSTSSQNSSQIPPNGPKPTSGQFSSTSIDPSLQTKTPPLPRRGMAPLQRSSRPWIFCTQVWRCHCWPHSLQCWASSG